MKRYFEILNQEGTQTLQLEIENGSQAETATVDQISKHFKLQLREISKKEYASLQK